MAERVTVEPWGDAPRRLGKTVEDLRAWDSWKAGEFGQQVRAHLDALWGTDAPADAEAPDWARLFREGEAAEDAVDAAAESAGSVARGALRAYAVLGEAAAIAAQLAERLQGAKAEPTARHDAQEVPSLFRDAARHVARLNGAIAEESIR